jgi:hypothetical protein
MEHFDRHSNGIVARGSSSSELFMHSIAHSHDDVGWIETKDSYYNGKVKHIIGNVVNELKQHKSYQFV